MSKSHKNNKSRITARERVEAYFKWLCRANYTEADDESCVLRMLQAHARAALRRRSRRA